MTDNEKRIIQLEKQMMYVIEQQNELLKNMARKDEPTLLPVEEIKKWVHIEGFIDGGKILASGLKELKANEKREELGYERKKEAPPPPIPPQIKTEPDIKAL